MYVVQHKYLFKKEILMTIFQEVRWEKKTLLGINSYVREKKVTAPSNGWGGKFPRQFLETAGITNSYGDIDSTTIPNNN